MEPTSSFLRYVAAVTIMNDERWAVSEEEVGKSKHCARRLCQHMSICCRSRRRALSYFIHSLGSGRDLRTHVKHVTVSCLRAVVKVRL